MISKENDHNNQTTLLHMQYTDISLMWSKGDNSKNLLIKSYCQKFHQYFRKGQINDKSDNIKLGRDENYFLKY